jgi:hypothetical protein
MIYDNKLLTKAFFGECLDLPAKTMIACKGGCGKSIKKPKSGVTNLIQHIEGAHSETMAATYQAFVKVNNIKLH